MSKKAYVFPIKIQKNIVTVLAACLVISIFELLCAIVPNINQLSRFDGIAIIATQSLIMPALFFVPAYLVVKDDKKPLITNIFNPAVLAIWAYIVYSVLSGTLSIFYHDILVWSGIDIVGSDGNVLYNSDFYFYYAMVYLVPALIAFIAYGVLIAQYKVAYKRKSLESFNYVFQNVLTLTVFTSLVILTLSSYLTVPGMGMDQFIVSFLPVLIYALVLAIGAKLLGSKISLSSRFYISSIGLLIYFVFVESVMFLMYYLCPFIADNYFMSNAGSYVIAAVIIVAFYLYIRAVKLSNVSKK